MDRKLSTVTIVGAGTMGHSLAVVFARGGVTVHLIDLYESTLEKAKVLMATALETLRGEDALEEPPETVIARITTSTDYRPAASASDLVIEAIVEDVEVKRKFFHELAECLPEKAIVASNTSYLDVFPLAPAEVRRRFLLTHYFSPPHLVPLVEIVGDPETPAEIVSCMEGWLKGLDMVPVVLKKFIPGLIVNRLQKAIGREVLHLIDEGYASAEEIDLAVEHSLALRMPIVGVVKRFDYAGLDMALRAQLVPSIGLVNDDRLSPTIVKLVEKGCLGVKSGEGFYRYSGSQSEILKERDRKLIQVRKLMKQLAEPGA